MRWLDYIRKVLDQATERRKFIRHPVDIEIHLSRVSFKGSEEVLMSDLSGGGLAVQSEVFYKEGTRLISHSRL